MIEMCSICDQRSVASMEDVHGRIHRACQQHKKYLKGWVQDVAAEQASECAAASRYEREYE